MKKSNCFRRKLQSLHTKPIFAVLSLCKSELSELFLNQLSILIQTPIFKELELLKLSDIRQIEFGKLMFSLNHSLLPSKFNNYFSLNKQVHSYATRHANDFHLPFCGTNLRKFSVSFQGPTYYNSIENDIKESNSLHLFKTKLKKKTYMNYYSIHRSTQMCIEHYLAVFTKTPHDYMNY